MKGKPMNRRTFLKRFGLGAGALVVGSQAWAEDQLKAIVVPDPTEVKGKPGFSFTNDTDTGLYMTTSSVVLVQNGRNVDGI